MKAPTTPISPMNSRKHFNSKKSRMQYKAAHSKDGSQSLNSNPQVLRKKRNNTLSRASSHDPLKNEKE